jgi:hypothetical protein
MKNENIVIFVIAESEQDYLDYVHRLETKCECLYLNKDGDRKPSNVAKDYSMHPVELHITKFASEVNENKILFIDYLLEFIKYNNLTMNIEREDGDIHNEVGFVISRDHWT